MPKKHTKYSSDVPFSPFRRKVMTGSCLFLCLTALIPATAQAAEALPICGETSIMLSGTIQPSTEPEISPDRVTYQEGFFYEPLSGAVKERITGISYGEDCIVPYEDLRYLNILYIDFHGEEQVGEIICNKAIAQDLVEIFYELYLAGYPLESVRLVDEYDADDEASMSDNNSSAFNFRFISHTTKISKHGLGMAVDINTLYNPYVKTVNGKLSIEPANAKAYVDRSGDFPHKIDHDDLCYKLFTRYGFTWGGDWTHSKDYQHFEKG